MRGNGIVCTILSLMTRRELEKKQKLTAVFKGLRRTYGEVRTPRIRVGTGLDTLVEAMLSQNTNMANAQRGYRMLRRRFKSWTTVMKAEVGEVQREIAICGLARMRARRLQALLRTIKEGQGRLSIDFLADRSVEEAMEFLLGFFGIGPKTAAFTLLFGLGHPVLPVDKGVLRVLRRLRLVRAKAKDQEAERVLSPLIARGRHYAMHVLLFRHAKERCRMKNPKCGECALLKICPHGRRVVGHRPPEVEVGMAEVRERKLRRAAVISAGLAKHVKEEDRGAPNPGLRGSRVQIHATILR
jgi:endonuclease-3